MLIQYPFKLNCKKTNIQHKIKANTGEGNVRELIITLTSGDKIISLNSSYSAAVVGTKPDGTEFANTAEIREGKVYYTLTTQNVAAAGDVDCQLRIYDQDSELYSAKFLIEVEENLSDEEAETSSNEWGELIEALRLAGKGKVYISEEAPYDDSLLNTPDLKPEDVYIYSATDKVEFYKCFSITEEPLHITWIKYAIVYKAEKVDSLLGLLSYTVKKYADQKATEALIDARNYTNSLKVYVDGELATKQHILTARNNIDITNNVISVDKNVTSDSMSFNFNGEVKQIDTSDAKYVLITDLTYNGIVFILGSEDNVNYKNIAQGTIIDVSAVDIYYLKMSRIGSTGSAVVNYSLAKENNIADYENLIAILATKADSSTTYSKTETNNLLADKQNTLSAGNGLNIEGPVISVDIDDLANTQAEGGNVLIKESNGKLAVYTSNIASDTVFQNTMPFYPAIRQGLTSTLTSNPLASKSYVDGLMSGAVKRQVVQTLPISDIDENTIYMLPKTTAETDNIYDEYMYINNAWELIGTTEVDLTDYVKNTDYATNSKGGVMKVGSNGFELDANKFPSASNWNYTQFLNVGNGAFVGKGTLLNVLAELLQEPKYELIDTVEITEPINKYIYDFDVSDQIYDDILIYATGVTGNGAGTAHIRLNNYDLYQYISTLTSTNKRYIIEFERKNGYIYKTQCGLDYSQTNLIPGVENTGYDKKIVRFDIGMASGATIDSGTIKIYGRKRF